MTEPALARGPACLTRALGVDGRWNGTGLLDGPPLHLRPAAPLEPKTVASGPRVGVSTAADVPWRFWVRGEGSVSAYRRSPRAAATGAPAARRDGR